MTKVVIAEDEPDIRDLIKFTLQFAGYEVFAGGNGEEGYELAKREKPDIVMMDVRMPKMTGYEACKLIKAEPKTAHIPVVFLSAKGQEAEVQTGLAVGATEYLLKPFELTQLTEKVAEILTRKK